MDVAGAEPVSARHLRLRPRPVRGRSRRGPEGGAPGSRPARRAGPDELGEDVGVEGISRRRAADGAADFEEVSWFADAVAAILVERDPERLTQAFSKADRGGRIYVDTGRNAYSATVAAAYAVRARPGAPVSAPCTWKDLEGARVAPRTFTLGTMARRIADVGDLWADMGQSSLSGPIERLRDRPRG